MRVFYKLNDNEKGRSDFTDEDADLVDLQTSVKAELGLDDVLPIDLALFVAPDADDQLDRFLRIKDVLAGGAGTVNNPIIVKIATSRKRRKTELVKFVATERKKNLAMDQLARKFGGLLDRNGAKEDVYKGLEHLAAQRGQHPGDKKRIPLLGLSAPSMAGKTEFLRWVFNNCCTFSSGDTANAQNILQRINNASPPGQEALRNLLVLFASFNQDSTYAYNEGPIVETTTERLLRSFHGNTSMGDGDSWEKQRYKDFSSLGDVMQFFTKRHGPTGFIFCLDELSKLKSVNETEYRHLMDRLLLLSQQTAKAGGLCVIICSALSVYDVGEVVVQDSCRALWPIRFPEHNEEMASKAAEKIKHETDVFSGAESSRRNEQFWVDVSINVLLSSTNVSEWDYIMNLPSSTTRVRPPIEQYEIPATVGNDYFFLLAARTALGKSEPETPPKERVRTVLNILHGHVSMKTSSHLDFVRDWTKLKLVLTLPPWRLLQVPVGSIQIFPLVQSWVLVGTRNFYYVYGPQETQKSWELATMAVLELRKAMLQSVNNGQPPTLSDVIDGLGVHHNVESTLMNSLASVEAATNEFDALPHGTTCSLHPCFHYSHSSNEKGVEGVFREGFRGVSIFFQMILYAKATPKNIKLWLDKARIRASELDYLPQKSIVQLFVTGAVEENIADYKHEWPANCMVFGTSALENLYEPFGSGIITDIVESLER